MNARVVTWADWTYDHIPSGHLVTARPLNLSVTAFIFVFFSTRRCRLPRSIAVLLLDVSVGSKPWRKRTGSASEIPTFIPLPVATGFSSVIRGSITGLEAPLPVMSELVRVGCVTASDGRCGRWPGRRRPLVWHHHYWRGPSTFRCSRRCKSYRPHSMRFRKEPSLRSCRAWKSVHRPPRSS